MFKKFFKGEDQTDLDKKLVYSFSKSKIPNLKQLKYVSRFLNVRELWLMRASIFVLAVSVLFLGVSLLKGHLVSSPAKGGEYVEGLVGYPKYINPLYSNFSDVDNDISNLIFSSLLKRDKNGDLKNDLAEGYQISEDKKSYIFQIRQDAKWQNGSPLTNNDIMFTFETLKNPSFKSSFRESFKNVALEKIDDKTLKFVLPESYAPFPNLLTFGILPQEIWSQISPSSVGLTDLNLKPIGSGPYKFKSFIKDKSGQIKTYNLTINENYYSDKPFVSNLIFKFYPSFEEAVKALNENSINGLSYLPRQFENNLISKNSLNIHDIPLSQAMAVFFNQKANGSLQSLAVREALALAIDKREIVSLLNGRAHIIDGPILSTEFTEEKRPFNMESASKKLADDGWKVVEVTENDIKEDQTALAEETKDKIKKQLEAEISMGPGKWLKKEGGFLTIKLTTVATEENQKVAEAIKTSWEKLGVKTDLEFVPAGQINGDTIKSRNFEALFYGQMMGADPDLYGFWHSSQIGENGLNIANYSSKEADRLLEAGRLTLNPEERKKIYNDLQALIINDLPAIFIYSPDYLYVQSKKIKGFENKNIFSPTDRFNNIKEWYLKTNKGWQW